VVAGCHQSSVAVGLRDQRNVRTGDPRWTDPRNCVTLVL